MNCRYSGPYREEHVSADWPDNEEQVEINTANQHHKEEKEGVTNIMAEMEQPSNTMEEDEESILVVTRSEVGEIIWLFRTGMHFKA